MDDIRLKKIFIICPIGKRDSETRERSDLLKEYIIKEVAKNRNYEVIRADEIFVPGDINYQITQHLIEDDIVIADITDHNPNVFYELAIRHVTEKPVILMSEENCKPPFDIQIQRIIFYNLKNLRIVTECKKELNNQLESIENGSFFTYSPIKNNFIFNLSTDGIKINKQVDLTLILKNQINYFREINENVKENSDQIRFLRNYLYKKFPEEQKLEEFLSDLTYDISKEENIYCPITEEWTDEQIKINIENNGKTVINNNIDSIKYDKYIMEKISIKDFQLLLSSTEIKTVYFDELKNVFFVVVKNCIKYWEYS